ncbi:hypothetical protein J8J14_11600 [Roseomonas sp. SSH11]|uniref:Phosphoribosylamine--glycine ligase n=1 Tax=Pararoseomonas baculiformis TaxID=2820812 RepID=A0ABS4AEH8_9PROT|nr:hypothetical protein [Pararoseomonas baculiformis]MBP0445423.1 hypothetical protein [Pararoseomonas baculiformis]
MIRAVPLFLLLAVAGCARDALPEPTNPTEAGCRSEARSAPEVREMFQRMPPPNNLTAYDRAQAEMAAVERRAYARCLRAQGLAPRGGVEPVQPLR